MRKWLTFGFPNRNSLSILLISEFEESVSMMASNGIVDLIEDIISFSSSGNLFKMLRSRSEANGRPELKEMPAPQNNAKFRERIESIKSSTIASIPGSRGGKINRINSSRA